MSKAMKAEGFSYYWLAVPKRGKWLRWPKSPIREVPSIPAQLISQANWKLPDEDKLLFWFDVPPGENPGNDGEEEEVEATSVKDDAKCVAELVLAHPFSATDLRTAPRSSRRTRTARMKLLEKTRHTVISSHIMPTSVAR